MAVFGVQLVITMVMASVLSKIIPHYSFAKWLLCKTGLKFYLHPTDEVLKAAAGLPKKTKQVNSSSKLSNTSKLKGGDWGDKSTFNIPKSINVSLEESQISDMDVIGLRFYHDYQWLLDYSFCAAIVYFLSEIYLQISFAETEVNLSMLWCLLVLAFCLKVMCSLTMLYFRGSDADAEKAMVVLSFFIYLLIALGMLVVSEDNLDLGLDLAFTSFNQSASAFLNAQGLKSTGLASKVTFKVVLAFICAIIGAFYTFPGLRLGKMHWDSLKYYGDSKIKKFVFHSSFLAPIILALMWVRPVGRKYFTEVIFGGYSHPLMTPAMFDVARLTLVVLIGAIRVVLMPLYLQSYLNMAYERVEELKKETGKVTNREFQQMISRVFHYLCVVTLQYIVPVIVCIFFALMCKTLGGYEWKDLVMWRDFSTECLATSTCSDRVTEFIPSPLLSLSESDSIADTSRNLSLGFEELKKIFTPEFYRGVLGFCTWWCIFAWFLSSTFGVLYQSYFTKV